MAAIVTPQDLERISAESVSSKAHYIIEQISEKLRNSARNFNRHLTLRINDIENLLFSHDLLQEIRVKMLVLYSNPDITDKFFININEIYLIVYRAFSALGYNIEVNRGQTYDQVNFKISW